MKLSNQELGALVLRELDQAIGQDADVLSTKRALALDYYNGTKPVAPVGVDSNGNPTAHRNSIVSKDVADALHSLLAQIQPIVKTTSVEFEPEHQDDEPQAQAESDLVHKIMEREGGFTAIFNTIHDALLTGNGWLKIEMEEEQEVTEKHYPANLDPIAQAILAMPKDNKETKEVEQETDGTFSVYTTRTIDKLSFKSIPPENILFSNNTNVNGIDDLRFVAETKLFTVNQLIDLGISRATIQDIPDANNTDIGIGNTSRQGIYTNSMDSLSIQDAEREKLVYICYMRVDLNDSGKSELREIWIGGREVLRNEPCSYIPYITGSAIPMPHRIEGTGLYELLSTIQDGKTYVLRQYLDNLSAMNASRLGVVEGQVNLNDLTNGRINGIVRMKNTAAIVPLPSADIGPQAMTGLQYFDILRTERIGSSVDFNDAQKQLMASSATAASGMLSKVEQQAGWFANNLVNTIIKPAFLMVHRVLREEYSEPIGAKLRGRWVSMNPSQFPVRKNVSITMGMTTAERASKIQALNQVVSQQQMLLTIGADGVLVDYKKFYNSMSDWIRANNLNAPEEYFIDPTSPEALQSNQQKIQAQSQSSQMTAQMTLQMKQMEQQFELLKQKNELEFKYWAEKLKANVEEAKMSTDILIQADRTDAQAAQTKIGASGNETEASKV